jgi:hypothetical protein
MLQTVSFFKVTKQILRWSLPAARSKSSTSISRNATPEIRLFGEQVHGRVRECADQHAPLAPDGLKNSLHQRGGFASARRAVDDGHALGRYHVTRGGYRQSLSGLG